MTGSQGRGESPLSPERVEAAAGRHLQALEMRRAGASYDAIAEQLGYAGHEGARKAVSAALKRTLEEPAAEVRALEVERLDRLWAKWYPLACGDASADLETAAKASELCLKLARRRADLLGLDSPRKVEAALVVDGRPVSEAEFSMHLKGLTDEHLDRLIAAARGPAR